MPSIQPRIKQPADGQSGDQFAAEGDPKAEQPHHLGLFGLGVEFSGWHWWHGTEPGAVCDFIGNRVFSGLLGHDMIKGQRLDGAQIRVRIDCGH